MQTKIQIGYIPGEMLQKHDSKLKQEPSDRPEEMVGLEMTQDARQKQINPSSSFQLFLMRGMKEIKNNKKQW